MTTIYIDIETTGLNPHTDQIKTVQIIEGDSAPELHIGPSGTELDQIRSRLHSATHIVGHNLSFDLGFLRHIPRPEQLIDTLYLSRLAYPQAESHSLDAVAMRVYGYDPYVRLGIDKKVMQRANWDQLTAQQRTYAELDVRVLPAIVNKLRRYTQHGVFKFDMRSVVAGLQVQQQGMPVLQNAVRRELAEQRKLRDTLLAELPFNPNSPKQAKAHLNLETTNDKQLAEAINNGNTLAQKVRDARKAIKSINFLEKLSASPRYFGTLSPAARSGRFTSNQNNIQNLPRNTKSMVGFTPADKRVVLSADFAQLELRTIACIAPDHTMLDLFKTGADMHGYMAEQMYGSGYTKKQRQIAKTFNFSLLYGAGPATVRSMLLAQTGISLTETEVKQLKNKWLGVFDGIAQWQRQGSTRHEMGTPHHTPHGRPYASERFTDHLSIENQGAGAEVARIALHQMVDKLPKEAKLFDFIHDSYWVECPDDPEIYKEAARVMHAAMKYAWSRAPFEKHGLEMPVDVGVAYNIKDADALENCLFTLGDENA